MVMFDSFEQTTHQTRNGNYGILVRSTEKHVFFISKIDYGYDNENGVLFVE